MSSFFIVPSLGGWWRYAEELQVDKSNDASKNAELF